MLGGPFESYHKNAASEAKAYKGSDLGAYSVGFCNLVR